MSYIAAILAVTPSRVDTTRGLIESRARPRSTHPDDRPS